MSRHSYASRALFHFDAQYALLDNDFSALRTRLQYMLIQQAELFMLTLN